MKFTFSCILALVVLVCASCERQQEKRVAEKPTPEKTAPERPVPEKLDHEKGKKSVPRSDNAESSNPPEAVRLPVMVSPAGLSRMFNEAEAAFGAKDYITGIAKIKELLTALGPGKEAPYEMLYFYIGLGNLLNNNMPDAEEGFKDSIKRYPNGEYTSRAYLGLGRACMMQDQPGKEKEARVALEKAAEDPKYKKEAELWMSELPQLPAVP
jgi:TolA-binding protein